MQFKNAQSWPHDFLALTPGVKQASNSQLVKKCLWSQQLSYCHKYTTKVVFCILIPQLFKFWKIKLWNYRTMFSKIYNKYLAKKCKLSVIGTSSSISWQGEDIEFIQSWLLELAMGVTLPTHPPCTPGPQDQANTARSLVHKVCNKSIEPCVGTLVTHSTLWGQSWDQVCLPQKSAFKLNKKLKPSKPIGVSRVGFGDCRKHKSLTKCSGFGHHLQSVFSQ